MKNGAKRRWPSSANCPVDAGAVPGEVPEALVWLVICLTGVVEVLSFGALAIANADHVGGLVSGCLTGVLGGWLARRSVRSER